MQQVENLENHASHHRPSKVLVENSAPLFKTREFPPNVDIQLGINRLSYGMAICLLAKKGKGRPLKIPFYIHPGDSTKLQWLIPHKHPRLTQLNLLSVTSVSDSPSFPLPKKLSHRSSLLLTIFYGAKQELVLFFDNIEEKTEWWAGLQYFIQRAHNEKKLQSGNAVSEIALNFFAKGDQNENQTLEKDELGNIMKQMQINIDSKTLNQKFEAFDKDKNGTIDKKEFFQFVQSLMRKPELLPLFTKYASGYKGDDDEPVMSAQELVRFYKEEQKMQIPEQEALEIITRFKKGSVSTYPQFEQIPKMSFYNFNNLLFSNCNLIFNADHSLVYQDMKLPLTDYYMNSSHNTYLEGNQLTSNSNIKSYIRALELGCRSVEIDLWNGDNAEPIVTHGHTLTSKMYFKDLVVALKEHAFVRTEYPLVLSFEMHCNLKGQQRIAEILEAEIKDQIFVLPSDYETMMLYPSPESLKRKFIIKSKGNVPHFTQDELHTDDDEPNLNLTQLNRIFYTKQNFMPKRYSADEEEEKQAINNIQAKDDLYKATRDYQNPQNPQTNATANLRSTEDVKIKVKKAKKTKSYSGLAKYYTQFGTKFDFKPNRSIWTISSLSEEKIKNFLKNNPRELVDFCKKYWIRVFPAGTRVDSSNYDPTRAWVAGAQMVALNYQTSDEAMLLNYAKFAANGGAGYVLKPEYLRSAALADPSKARYPHEFTKPKVKLTIKIISGQQFQFEQQTASDIIDPFVEVKLKGLEVDEESNKPYRTHTIQDNGFNPVWSTESKSCEVEYSIVAPELATLVVKVYDGHVHKNSKVAWYAIEVPHIAEGYRAIPMLNSRFDAWAHCYLFVHVKVEHLL